MTVTSGNSYITGNVYMSNNLFTPQSYVTSHVQGYITATLGVNVNMNTNNLNLTSGKITMNGRIIYFNTATLSTQYSGACIVLWPGTGTATSTSTDYYGFGMNGVN